MKTTLIHIVQIANEIIMDIYNKPDINNVKVKIKSDKSPLTEADTKSSDWICSQLEKFDPSIPIICEETDQQRYNQRKNFSKFWLVDPLDGTKEFIKRNGEFTVNIALVEKNAMGNFVPVAGVISIPVTGEVYYGEQFKGAWKIDAQGIETKMECEPFSVTDPITIVVSRSHRNKATEDFFKQYNVVNTIVSGSSLKFMKLCENKAQVYPRLHPCMEWDIAAADAILREAGGIVQTPDSRPMPYNKKNLLVRSFIAYGKIPRKMVGI